MMVRIRPGSVWNTKMRSERMSASSMLWVTKITVAPVRDHMARKSSCSCSRVWASSAPLGRAHAVDLERELDIAHHCAPRQQAEILEHHARVLARTRHRRACDG